MSVIDRCDLDFLVFDWLGAEALATRPLFTGQSAGDYAAFLDLGERLAEGPFLGSYKISDGAEPRFPPTGGVVVQRDLAEAVRAYLDAGLQLASVEAAHGGMQFPMVVNVAMMAVIVAGNVSASGFPMLSAANARLIRDHDSARQAGPRYRLFGRKMWISAADHDVTPDITHLVLAKIANPDGSLPPGSKGTSLFIVPKNLTDAWPSRENDVTVIGLNHKMGYRDIPNCALNFGDGRTRPGGNAGAVGCLLGGPGQGLAIMFQMMNEARIDVGLSGAALACRGYLLSRDYARERAQGRQLSDKAAARLVPIIRHLDVRRMLLAQKAIAEGDLALCLYSARLVDLIAMAACDAERERAQRLLDILTPIVKSWPAEQGPVANSLAIQVHGGYGYTHDFSVEQLYRDNRLNPIHEGTTGIQGLNLAGGKILADGGRSFDVLAAEMRRTEERAAEHAGLAAMTEALGAARSKVGRSVEETQSHAMIRKLCWPTRRRSCRPSAISSSAGFCSTRWRRPFGWGIRWRTASSGLAATSSIPKTQ